MRSKLSISSFAFIPEPFSISLSRMVRSPSCKVYDVIPYLREMNASMYAAIWSHAFRSRPFLSPNSLFTSENGS